MVGSALESGGRAASHGLHDVALQSAARVLEISPQCTAAQEMRVSGEGRGGSGGGGGRATEAGGERWGEERGGERGGERGRGGVL